MFETRADNRIPVCVETIQIEVLIFLRIRKFLYLCMSSTLEIKVKVLGKIPPYAEITIPQEL